MPTQLASLSATEAIAHFEALTLSPVELVRTVLERFNMLSRCPVMSVPSGRAETGVPTGTQIVGRSFDDVSVFHAAAAYEKAVGGFDMPPLEHSSLA